MSSVAKSDLLIELGTEELPPKALRTLELAFAGGIRQRLADAGLAHGTFESFATPRRLAVLVKRLAVEQAEQRIQRRGPPVSAAFDASGQPTKAATAFAQSCGVAVDALAREQDARGNTYLSFSGSKPGATTASLLPAILSATLDALPIPRRMRWGAGEAQFVRPVHWLVMLFGREVIPARILDTQAGASTRGHRFMASPRPILLSSPSGYAKKLETSGRVIASFEVRRERIRAGVIAAAEAVGGQALLSDALLDEVTALVEWPVPLAGRFEERFLELPREVLIATLQEHQRYFPVTTADGALLPWFITVSNIESSDPGVVRAGNERVVRPRLSDAAFFWQQDRRTPLHARRASLDAVTYQAKLGSVGAKATRVGALAQVVARTIGANPQLAARAAELAKCDLVSAMVGEFPELQGVIGQYYALADGEQPEVAAAVAEHYLPRSASDALPATRTGMALAIADKLDTLAGIFAIGQKPSGTKDPFGLRRAAIGVLRIGLEKRLDIDLPALVTAAVDAQPAQADDTPEKRAAVAGDVLDYVMERLRGIYLEEGAALRVSTEAFDAVLATQPTSPIDFDARLRALIGFLDLPEAASLAAANKRIANLLKKSAGDAQASANVDPARLQHPAERALFDALGTVDTSVPAAVARGEYASALGQLARLKPAVDAFFDGVMVMDPDTALRANRLALLTRLRALFAGIADLSRLPG